MLIKLPRWVLVNKFPAMYDTESLTSIEQTARVYGKMNELIDTYNNWVDSINTTIEEWVNVSDKDREAFEVGIRQEFQDFIDVIDLKVRELEKWCKDNLNSTVNQLWKEMEQQGVFQDLLERNIGEIKSKQEELESYVGTHNGQLRDLQDFVNNNTEDIYNLKNSVADHTTRLGGIDRNITELFSFLGPYDYKLNVINEKIKAIFNAITQTDYTLSALNINGLDYTIKNDGSIELTFDTRNYETIDVCPIAVFYLNKGTYEFSGILSHTTTGAPETDLQYTFNTYLVDDADVTANPISGNITDVGNTTQFTINEDDKQCFLVATCNSSRDVNYTPETVKITFKPCIKLVGM